MLKVQIALIAILIASVALVSCDRAQKVLEPVVDDMMAADDTTMDMMTTLDEAVYMSWAHVMLPAPAPTEEATHPGETGGVHGLGTRTVYINDAGAMANNEGTAYPAGTVIVKAIMDDANTFVAKIATMEKTDDPMYANHNGWIYKKYGRSAEDAEYMQVRGAGLEDAGNGCHGCHAKADNDSVFVSLSMGDAMMAEMDETGEADTADAADADDMAAEDMADDTDAGADTDADTDADAADADDMADDTDADDMADDTDAGDDADAGDAQ